VPGPLAPFADGFRAELDRLGYTPFSREFKVNQVSRLSRWLDCRGLAASDLDEAVAGAFLADFGRGRRGPPTLETLRPLLDWLGGEGVIAWPAAAASGSAGGQAGGLVDGYRRWMAAERGLAARTTGRYEKTARRFLAGRERVAGGGTGAEGLDAAAATGFLLAEAGRGLRPGSLQGRVAELRSLLTYLYLAGVTDSPLAAAVPPVPGWKDTAAPGPLPSEQVRALLNGCRRDTAAGRRDLAMLMLMARLGLRAAEVAGLRLADFDWRAGELAVRGKGRRTDQMPLPADVGEAIACYLRLARPRAATGVVFLTVVAPHRPLVPTAVSEMVRRRCVQAGLAPARAHRLRHTLATELLGRGFTLPEIGQALRHASPATTAIYVKSRPRRAADAGAALAGGCPVTRLEAALADYLSLRRSLGHKLDQAGRQLTRFVTYLDFTGAETITMPAVLEFVLGPDLDPASTIPARRLTAVRGFARYLAGQDGSSVIPPAGLVASRARHRIPHIFSDADVAAVIASARASIPAPFRQETVATLIGLLAVTGNAGRSAR
jgi:integrase/recombinase XerD